MLQKLGTSDPDAAKKLEELINAIHQAIGVQDHSASLVFAALWNSLVEVWAAAGDEWKQKTGVDAYEIVDGFGEELARAAWPDDSIGATCLPPTKGPVH